MARPLSTPVAAILRAPAGAVDAQGAVASRGAADTRGSVAPQSAIDTRGSLAPQSAVGTRNAVDMRGAVDRRGAVDTRGAVDGRGAVGARAGPGTAARTDAKRTAWRWGLLLAAGWLVQAGLRAWLSRMQVVPLANPDEAAYLIAARVLAGGPGADFSGSTLYQGGYPLLITPVYWFTRNPVTVYHAVLLINAAISAAVLPLGYLACRRLGLGRPAGYGTAMVAGLIPAAFLYSQFAMADAIFPVITLAWLLATHSWLTAPSARARYAAAAGSALLAGFAYAVHSRGIVLLACYAGVGVVIAWRRRAARGSVAAAGLTALVTAGAGWALNRYLASALYAEGTRSLSGQLTSTLGSRYGAIHVAEMAAGQLWRVTLDSWGIAGIGLIAAVAVAVRGGPGPSGPGVSAKDRVSSGARSARHGAGADMRIMAALSVAVTLAIACSAPAALPSDQAQAWASGRYLDGMTVVFFLAGAAVLLRARTRRILVYAACAAGLTVAAAVTVASYAGSSLPTSGFGSAFNFAGPAVLTQDWTQASVPLATAVALGLLGLWLAFALALRRLPAAAAPGAVLASRAVFTAGVRLAFAACVAAVSLVAVAQMTSNVARAGTVQAQAVAVPAGALRPGAQVAIASSLGWQVWMPESFEVSWTKLQFFDPASQPPPAGVTSVETPWPGGQSAQASWPHAPAGWRVAASSQPGGWVLWQKG